MEIWRKNHALGILEAIRHVFNDIDIYLDLSAAEDEGLDIDTDWEEVRDDSSFLNMFNSQSMEWSQTDTSADTTLVENRSDFFEALVRSKHIIIDIELAEQQGRKLLSGIGQCRTRFGKCPSKSNFDRTLVRSKKYVVTL